MAEYKRFIEPSRDTASLIGKSVTIKGEVSCSEDLVLDGRVEGNVDLGEHRVTVRGEVEGDIRARQIVVLGRVLGDVTAAEAVEVRGTGRIEGDLEAVGLTVEERAQLKGNVRMQLAEPRAAATAAPEAGCPKDPPRPDPQDSEGSQQEPGERTSALPFA